MSGPPLETGPRGALSATQTSAQPVPGVRTPPEPRSATLWTPPRVAQLRKRPRKRTVTLPSGERALVTVDDSGTVTQVERAERLDAIVRPDVIRIKVRRYWGAHGHPNPEGPLKGRDGRYGTG